MATLSTGYTWQSGDTVTPALLNQTVNSANITNIANADVASNAAIAGSKITPSFGSQAVSTTGTLAAGNTTITGTMSVSGAITATGGVTGNASTASAWQTGRNLSLTGDVTATLSSVTGSGNVSAAATIANAAVTAAKLSGAQTGSAPIFGVRAWGKFEGRSDNAACVVNASGNVTSVTRTASGIYEVVMTTALPDANYAILCTSTGAISRIESFTETATTFRLEFITTAGAASNPAEISFMVIR